MKAKAKLQAPTRPPLPPDSRNGRLPVKAPLPPLPLSEKLAALRAAEKAAYLAIQEAGGFALGGTPRVQKWKRLLHKRIALEESFFVYEGREIKMGRVAYQSGDLNTNSLRLREGDEELFRDDKGQYYLRRKWSSEDVPRVHRLSLAAAVLWAIARANPETNALRIDAARVLSITKEAA